MTKFLKTFLICLFLLTLTACFQVETVVKVKTDGSGVIEETFLMKKDFLDQMKVMIAGMAAEMGQSLPESGDSGETRQDAGAQSKTKEFDMFDEAKLKEGAKDMGEGVTYVKGSKVVVEGYEGYRAIYAFRDINKLRINQNPGDKVPGGSQEGNSESKAAKEYLTFVFTGGKPAELIIKSPASGFDKKAEDSSEGAKPSQDNAKAPEEMLSQMKRLFQGMKFGLAVVVDGDIIETNATHRDGAKITLLELDFGKLVENPEKFKKFNESKPKTMEEAKLLMQDLPGIKVDLNSEIKVRFDQQKI